MLTACTIRPFVMNAEMLLGLSTKVFGKTFTDTVVRKTFFAHFVAGESAEGAVRREAPLARLEREERWHNDRR